MGLFGSASGSAGGVPTPMKVVCTSCGAPLRLRPNKTEIFCEHCGTRNYFAAPVIPAPAAPVRQERGKADPTPAVSIQPSGSRGTARQPSPLKGMATFFLWGVAGVILLILFLAFVINRI